MSVASLTPPFRIPAWVIYVLAYTNMRFNGMIMSLHLFVFCKIQIRQFHALNWFFLRTFYKLKNLLSNCVTSFYFLVSFLRRKNTNIWPIGKLLEQEGGWRDGVFRVNRNRCQFCRLQKCLALGMSRDGEFIHSTTCSHSFIYSFIHTPSSGIAAVIWQCTVLYHSIISNVTLPLHLYGHFPLYSFIHSFIHFA
jgi:hypothetical protein